MEIISVYSHLLLLPTIPLLVLSWLFRSHRSAMLLGVGAAAFVLLFGWWVLPDFSMREAQADLTVMTFNTGNGQAPWDGLHGAIRRSGADIVAIQESVKNEVPRYRRDLADLYPSQVFYSSGITGIGMLSRYPMLRQWLEYPPSGRSYLVVELELEGRSLTVINAHPPVIFGPGAPQAPGRADFEIMADLAAGQGMAILAGDLNLTDQNQGYAAIVGLGLVDAFREAGTGPGLTYPRRSESGRSVPLLRIDYILTTAELRPLDAWVGEDGGSDHLPVLATFDWRQDG